MELVEGEPLSATLAREGRLTAGVTLGIVAQAAGALHAAHTAGIVHRDVKPGNLLITPDGQVKITDFGIARAALGAHLTQSGMVMGTAQYVSPEQATARPVTPATDIYSLGVVAYECLAGRPPFTADTPIALALAHVNERPPRLPGDVPPPVAALVGQMLAKEPSARPASARLVADRASALRDSRPAGEDAWAAGPAGPAAWVPEASPTGPRPRQPGTAPMAPAGPRRARSRRPAALIVAAGAVGAVVATSAVALMATNRHPAPAGTSTPASSAPAHRTHRPSHAPPPRSSAPGQPATPAAPAPSPAPSTRHPSPTPTTPATPATPTPSSPASSPPTSPPTSPPSTPPTSPTQSGSPASSSPNGTAQPGAAQPAAPSGLQAANVRTQDR
jgi:serine/threonine-protein kinase